MATTGTEKHCKLCLMLMKGGTKASERLLLKRVEELSPKDHKPFPWTTDDFLQSKQKEIKQSKLSRANIQVLFPPKGKTDLTKWDFSLFCNVLTMFCDLKHIICLDVKQLQTLRNDLCHVNEPTVDECKYKNYYETIEVCIKRIVAETGDQKTKNEIEKIVADIDSGPLSIADALKGMHVFYSMERGIQEKLEDLKDGNENILRRVEKIEDHITQHHPEAKHNITIPGLDFFIELKNLSKESEDNISSVLVQLFEEVIRGEEGLQSSLPQDSYIKIREAVFKTFKLFLSKGWRITSTRHECIQLHIACETFTSLASLFREYASGSINKQLKDLKDAISLTEDGENVELETVVFKDEFWKVINKSVAGFEDILSEDNDIDPALMENLQLYDSATTHRLSIIVRKTSEEEMHEVEGDVDSGLEACLKQIEIEIGKEFNLPHLSIQASYATKQSLTDSQTPAEKPDEVSPKEKDLEEKLRPLQRATSSKVLLDKGSSVDPSEKHLLRTPMAVSIPDDILNGLKTAFSSENDADSLARVIWFLSDSIAKNIEEPFIHSLQGVVSIPALFKKVAERMAEDTKTAEKDPQYRQLMYDVWNKFMKDNLSEHPERGQRWELAITPQNSNPMVVSQFCFMRAVSRLPPESYIALASAVQSMGGSLALYGGRALSVARKAQPVVRVALVTVYLAWSVIQNIKRWWKGEITGKRCVKNIIDRGVGVAAGIGGGIGGEMIGATLGAVAGPVGMAVGAVIGAVAGAALASFTAESLCDRLTQWAFGMPKSEALENAYGFLGVSSNASNSDVNSRYRRLALKYHPDKGGNAENWTHLQYSMAIVREARGEP